MGSVLLVTGAFLAAWSVAEGVYWTAGIVILGCIVIVFTAPRED